MLYGDQPENDGKGKEFATSPASSRKPNSIAYPSLPIPCDDGLIPMTYDMVAVGQREVSSLQGVGLFFRFEPDYVIEDDAGDKGLKTNELAGGVTKVGASPWALSNHSQGPIPPS